jgi:L-threonylcarbamoyladenylate synthase
LKSLDKIVPVHAGQSDDSDIARAAQIVRNGGVVVFPTHGLYGLGADPFNAAAVERIFAIKGRQTSKALLVLIADMASLDRVALPPDTKALAMMRHFWPGRVTFILHARHQLPAALTGFGNKIGVRLVHHPVAAALVRAVGAPLTGTSANLSDSDSCASVTDMDAKLIDTVDLVLDAGPLAGGSGSTVVDITGRTPQVLREGSVPAEEILRVWVANPALNQ